MPVDDSGSEEKMFPSSLEFEVCKGILQRAKWYKEISRYLMLRRLDHWLKKGRVAETRVGQCKLQLCRDPSRVLFTFLPVK